MRFATVASAAALAAPALVAASSMADLKNNLGSAHVHNRCDYPVYLWSVKKDQGCDSGEMKTLQPGETYSEKYRDDYDQTGVSIKISKSTRCKGQLSTNENIDITQLEYHINHASPEFNFNFLDVSFVDCLGGDCPGRDKFYLKSGNNGDVRLATAGADKAICPILSCSSEDECARMAYINPDDVQTKSCEPAADMDFYLCTDSAEDGDSYEKEPEAEPSKPAEKPVEEKPKPSSIKEAEVVKAAAAPEVTPAPKDLPVKEKKIKTEIVYVTKYEYVNAKRHAHGHAHKRFNA